MAEVPVPPQYVSTPATDLRAAPLGPRGYKSGVKKTGRPGTKRKLEEYAIQAAEEAERGVDTSIEVGTVKKPKLDTTGLARTSNRSWKAPAPRAGTLKAPGLSTAWADKMRAKKEQAMYKEQKKEALDAFKAKKSEARHRKEAALSLKAENRAKSEVTVRVSADTARRMLKTKKGRKQLRAGGV